MRRRTTFDLNLQIFSARAGGLKRLFGDTLRERHHGSMSGPMQKLVTNAALIEIKKRRRGMIILLRLVAFDNRLSSRPRPSDRLINECSVPKIFDLKARKAFVKLSTQPLNGAEFRLHGNATLQHEMARKDRPSVIRP